MLHKIYAWKQELYQHLTGSDVLVQDELHRKVRQWFAGEELLMIRSDYPEYEHQRLEHQCFLTSLLPQVERENENDLQKILHRWMRQHDFFYDRHFQIYFDQWQKTHSKIPAWYHWNPEYVLLLPKHGRIG